MPGAYKHAIFLAVALILGCAGPKPAAPVSDRTTTLRAPAGEYRLVMRGDTLYSIAWEAGRDYKEVAAWNNIPPPYLLYPGQQLRLYPPDKKQAARAAGPQKKTPSRPKRKAAAPAPKPKPKAEQPRKSVAFGPWAWPTRGKVINAYSANGPNKGLDIGGRRGQTIVAAAPGKVVYIGSGLRGYGQLIIIKHNDEFLSAYAHNDKIYVKEGDVIKRGQKIAEMGSSGAEEVKLHFQIRSQGIPVNPLLYLPKQ